MCQRKLVYPRTGGAFCKPVMVINLVECPVVVMVNYSDGGVSSKLLLLINTLSSFIKILPTYFMEPSYCEQTHWTHSDFLGTILYDLLLFI